MQVMEYVRINITIHASNRKMDHFMTTYKRNIVDYQIMDCEK